MRMTMKKKSGSPFSYKQCDNCGQTLAQPLQLTLFASFARLSREQHSQAIKRGLAHKKK